MSKRTTVELMQEYRATLLGLYGSKYANMIMVAQGAYIYIEAQPQFVVCDGQIRCIGKANVVQRSELEAMIGRLKGSCEVNT